MKDLYSLTFADAARIINAISYRIFAKPIFCFKEDGVDDDLSELIDRAAIAASDIPVASDVAPSFIAQIPELKRLLYLDALCIFKSDPAATDIREVISCYPGFFAIFCYRAAHVFYLLGVPLLPRLICEYAHSLTGIDIHPGATIGERFAIDHGTGIVIGETAIIGDDVRIYQGVTIGAKSFPRTEDGEFDRTVKRHPTIGNRVVIYASAAIFGADTVIGDGAVIGANARVTESVPQGAKVYYERGNIKNE